jgi:CBS domain-containing protein
MYEWRGLSRGSALESQLRLATRPAPLAVQEAAMTVGQICSRDVVVADRDDTIAEAARRIRTRHVGTLVVVDTRGGRPVPLGMLTDRDIVVSVLADDGEHIDVLRVGDVMCPRLVTARENENLTNALKRMRQHGVRRIPVVTDQGYLAGILAFDDLIDYMTQELEDVAGLIGREQEQEREVKA